VLNVGIEAEDHEGFVISNFVIGNRSSAIFTLRTPISDYQITRLPKRKNIFSQIGKLCCGSLDTPRSKP
jgi:hypothetical protein